MFGAFFLNLLLTLPTLASGHTCRNSRVRSSGHSQASYGISSSLHGSPASSTLTANDGPISIDNQWFLDKTATEVSVTPRFSYAAAIVSIPQVGVSLSPNVIEIFVVNGGIVPCYSSPIYSSCTEVTDSTEFYRFGTNYGPISVFRLSLDIDGVEGVDGFDMMPPARFEHTAVAFSDVSLTIRPVVFYGGRNSSGAAVGDTWVIEAGDRRGLKWSLSTSGPVRFGHTAVANHSVMVVFGGCDGERYYNDVYAYDVETASWSTLPSQGEVPQPRAGHTAVLVDGHMLIHGGSDNRTHFNNTYVYDLKATRRWVRLQVSCPVNPTMFYAASTVFRYNRDSVVWIMFGSPTWSLNSSLTMTLEVTSNGYPIEDSWKILNFSLSPGPRWRMSLLQSTVKGRQVAYMLGGAISIHPKLHKHTEPVSDFWYITEIAQMYQWNFVCPVAASPPPRAGFAATLLNQGQMVFTFGGVRQTHTSLITFADANGWGFPLVEDGSLGAWEEYVPTITDLLGVVGTVAVTVPMVFGNDSGDTIEVVLVFGGFLAPSDSNKNGRLTSSLLVIAPSLLSWFVMDAVQNKPSPRAFHTGVLYRSTLYVFGGLRDLSIYSPTDDLWSWQWSGSADDTPSSWKQHDLNTSGSLPEARFGHSAVVAEAWKDVGDVMVIYGGTDGVTVFQDMWIYAFESGLWLKVKLTDNSQIRNPLPPLFAHSAVMVGSNMFVYGGCRAVPTNTALSADSPLPQCPVRNISSASFIFDTVLLTLQELHTLNAESRYFHSSTNLYGEVLYTNGGLRTDYTISSNNTVIIPGCNPGYEGSISNGSCSQCPIGSYGEGGEFPCTKCELFFTTEVPGKVSPAACNVCQPSACNGRGTCTTPEPNVRFKCTCQLFFLGDRCNTIYPLVLVGVLILLLLCSVIALPYVVCVYRENAELEKEVVNRKKAWTIYYNKEITLKSGGLIREATNSRVERASYRNLDVVVKTIKTHRDKFDDEMDFMTRIRHPNIVLFFGGGTRSPLNEEHFLVMEYMSEQSLKTVLRDPRKYPLLGTHKRQLAIDIAEAMKFLHGEKCVHRDLKSDNVVVTSCSQRENGLKLIAKLADFGEALILKRGFLSDVWKSIRYPCKKLRRRIRRSRRETDARASERAGILQNEYGRSLSTMTEDTLIEFIEGVGTKGYQAPEVIEHRRCSRKIDVYSFGIVMWELWTRRAPYENEGTRCLNGWEKLNRKIVSADKRPQVTRDTPDDWRDLMTSCWDKDVKNRPEFFQILRRLNVELLHVLHTKDLFPLHEYHTE